MRFILGFVSASALWGGMFLAYLSGQFDFLLTHEEQPREASAADEPDESPSQPRKKQHIRRPRLRRKTDSASERAGARGDPSAQTTTGDDIGWDKQRSIDMNAGEGQLSGTQIDAGFDSMMGRIRRCLLLVPSDGEVTGKLVFGMRVASDGKARAVSLSGPSLVTSGESGSCLRDAAKSIQFRAYQGPDTVFKYPITLQ